MAMDPKDFETEDDSGGWLISYADMMTLIACFFILMMAFANYDPVGFNTKAEELSKHFRKDKYKSSLQKLKDIREEVAIHPDMPNKMKVSLKDSELVIVFSGSALFDNGSYQLNKTTNNTINSLIDIIKTQNPNYRILIEGHADDNLIKQKNMSNWLISSMRAAKVVERFEYFGFPPQNITAIAKGDTQKILKSIDKKDRRIEKNARINRRVVIRVLEPRERKQHRMGLGVYFKESTDNLKEGHQEIPNK